MGREDARGLFGAGGGTRGMERARKKMNTAARDKTNTENTEERLPAGRQGGPQRENVR